MNQLEIAMVNGEDGVRIASSLDFPPSEQIEAHVHERFKQEMGWLQEPGAPETLTSMLSVVRQEQAIGMVTLTEGYRCDLPGVISGPEKWVMLSDMELEPAERGHGLGIATVAATAAYVRSEYSDRKYVPTFYYNEASKRMLKRLARQGLADWPRFPESLWPANSTSIDRILDIGIILDPLMRKIDEHREQSRPSITDRIIENPNRFVYRGHGFSPEEHKKLAEMGMWETEGGKIWEMGSDGKPKVVKLSKWD